MNFYEAFKKVFEQDINLGYPKLMMYSEPKGSGYFTHEDLHPGFILTANDILKQWNVCEEPENLAPFLALVP